MSLPSSPKKSARLDDSTVATINELRAHNAELRKELKEFNSQLEVIKAQHEKALAAARVKQGKRDRTDGPLTGTPQSGDEATKAELKLANRKITVLTKANADLKKAATGSGADKIRKLMSEITQLKDTRHEQKVEISTLKNEVARMRSTAFKLTTDEDRKHLEGLEKQIRVANAKAQEYKRKMEESERRGVKQQEALVEFKNKAQQLGSNAEAGKHTHKELEQREKIKALEKKLADFEAAREEERRQQSNVVSQFNRKIQIQEMTIKGLREQMTKNNLTPEEVKINIKPHKLAKTMTRAEKLRREAIRNKKIMEEKNRTPVLLAKLPKSAKRSARSPQKQAPPSS